MLGAALIATNVDASALPPDAIGALPNALALQGVVAASWVYSARVPADDSQPTPILLFSRSQASISIRLWELVSAITRISPLGELGD